MFPVQQNDILKKVSNYQLTRGVITFDVTLSHVLTGNGAGLYHADISYRGRELSQEFWGHGKSEQEALRKCLQAIEHLSPRQLLERE